MIVTEGMPLVKIKALFLFFLLRIFKKKRYSSLTDGCHRSLFLFYRIEYFLGQTLRSLCIILAHLGIKKVKTKTS